MLFENSFELEAPIDEVWRTLLDVERVAPCMPGAEVLGRTDEGAYRVAVKVKVGPMTMKYRGQVEIVEQDPEAHRAVMKANAKEARGQGTAAAEIEMTLSQDGPVTRCAMHTDVKLSGKAAAMGQGVIRDVSAALIADFARNLTTMMSSGAPAAAPTGGGTAVAEPPAPAATAAAAEEQAPSPTEPPPDAAAPEPPASEPASLEAGALVARVVAGRLENPRTLLLAATGFGLFFLVIGFVIGWLAR
ncbi:MAG: SRPBCC family protein [Solirubrobacterales bacterium]